MLIPDKKSKLSIILLIAIFSIQGVLAQQGLEAVDGTVWLNPDHEKTEVSYSCENLDNITIKDDLGKNLVLEEQKNQGNITTSPFRQVGEPGTYQLVQNCKNSSNSENTTLELRNLTVEDLETGKGFFGEEMTWGEFSTPVELSFKVDNGDFEKDDAEFETKSAVADVESYVEEESALELSIGSNFNPESTSLPINVNYQGQDELKTTIDVPVNVYPWKLNFKGSNPGRKLDYRNLDQLSYNFDVSKGRGVSTSLYEEDFRVSIKDIDSQEIVYEDKEWVETSDQGNSDYRLELENIPDLETGRYNFKFKIHKNGREVPVDNLRVVKSLEFEGQILDSTGSAVRAEMELLNKDRTVPVNADQDGLYSRKIKGDRFETVEMGFYDTGQDSTDSKFTITDVDLGTDTSGNGAIKYDYWENPPVSIPGLDPVNMMAVKFGHKIEGSAETSMRFNPSNINPEDLEVFECSSWNFGGRSCLSNWQKVDDGDTSISYTNWNVKITDLDLHHISKDVGGDEKDILLNSYIVGTSSRLGLKGEEAPLQISQRKLKAGEELEISGSVVGSQGESVENAEVEVELRKNDETVSSFEVESGEEGEFKLEENAPSESGEYRIKIRIEKEPYKPFETISDSKLEVDYEKSLKLKNPEKQSIELGSRENLTFEVENDGQVNVEDIKFTLEGLEKDLYRQISSPDNLQTGEKSRAKYSVEIPKSYCPYPCGQPPSFTLKAEGSALNKEVKSMTTVFTEVSDGAIKKENSTRNDTETKESQSGLFKSAAQAVTGPTGSFLQRQSSVNIALGLIMLFTMILAVAVKHRGDSTSQDRRGLGRQGSFQTYSSSNNSGFGNGSVSKGNREGNTTTGEDSFDKFSENNKAGFGSEYGEGEEESRSFEFDKTNEEGTESEDKDESTDKFVCERTGEEFDTKAALKMHKQMNGIE